MYFQHLAFDIQAQFTLLSYSTIVDYDFVTLFTLVQLHLVANRLILNAKLTFWSSSHMHNSIIIRSLLVYLVLQGLHQTNDDMKLHIYLVCCKVRCYS